LKYSVSLFEKIKFGLKIMREIEFLISYRNYVQFRFEISANGSGIADGGTTDN
jgi:hypothetical protein